MPAKSQANRAAANSGKVSRKLARARLRRAATTPRGWRVEYRLALRASLRFIEYAPILFQIKPKAATLSITPFTGLPDEDRERVCRRLDQANGYNVRSLFRIAKTLVYGVYYSQDAVERTVGYDAAANKIAAEAWAREQGR